MVDLASLKKYKKDKSDKMSNDSDLTNDQVNDIRSLEITPDTIASGDVDNRLKTIIEAMNGRLNNIERNMTVHGHNGSVTVLIDIGTQALIDEYKNKG